MDPASLCKEKKLDLLVYGSLRITSYNVCYTKLLRSRRTARRFSEREVSDELLEVLLDAGLRAPSNDHLRKWEFVVVRDRDRRLELVDRVSRDRFV